MGKPTCKAEMTGRDFDALPAAEKERIYHELDNLTTTEARQAFRPMTQTERRNYMRRTAAPARNRRAHHNSSKAQTSTISVSVEKSFLRLVDAYAKAKGIKRSELVMAALRSVIGKSA